MKRKVLIGLLILVMIVLLSACRQVLGSKSDTILEGTPEPQEQVEAAASPTPMDDQTLAPVDEASDGPGSAQEATSIVETLPAMPTEATPLPTLETTSEPTSTETSGQATETPPALIPTDQPAATPEVITTEVSGETQVGLPATHNLRKGEYPWCIARRYNVDPHELMRLNGFHNGQIFYPGQVVAIPQTGNPFPGKRALHPHPDAYRVKPGDTLWSIACYYGDVDPRAIAALNGIEKPKKLKIGQVLQIPAESAEMAGSLAGSLPETEIGEASLATETAEPTTSVPGPTASLTPEPAPSSSTIATSAPAVLGTNRREVYVGSLKTDNLDPASVIAQPGQAPAGQELISFLGIGGAGDICGGVSGQQLLFSETNELNQNVYLTICNWQKKDPLNALLTYPDGRQVELSPLDKTTFIFPSLISDPAGEYQVFVQGQNSGQSLNGILTITQPNSPRVMVDFDGYLYLYGFKPDETVNVEVYQLNQDFNPVFKGMVEYQVNATGELRLLIEGYGEQLNYDFAIIGDQSGGAKMVVNF